jgi:hypothetical protein
VTCQYSIIDRDSHRTLTGWPTRKSPCAYTMLAVGAQALCFDDEKLHCQAINGGSEISIPRQLRSYRLNQAAADAAWVVAEKWEYDHGPWWGFLLTPLTMWVPDPGSHALPRQRVVFDLRSGKLITSWKPRIQHSTSPFVQDWPYHCALSANGEFLAESGDGTLELYRLAP